jgi:hypothetical protein
MKQDQDTIKFDHSKALAQNLVARVFEQPTSQAKIGGLNTIVDIANSTPDGNDERYKVTYELLKELNIILLRNHLGETVLEPSVEYHLWSIIQQEPFFDETGTPWKFEEGYDCHHLEPILNIRQKKIEQWAKGTYVHPIVFDEYSLINIHHHLYPNTNLSS